MPRRRDRACVPEHPSSKLWRNSRAGPTEALRAGRGRSPNNGRGASSGRGRRAGKRRRRGPPRRARGGTRPRPGPARSRPSSSRGPSGRGAAPARVCLSGRYGWSTKSGRRGGARWPVPWPRPRCSANRTNARVTKQTAGRERRDGGRTPSVLTQTPGRPRSPRRADEPTQARGRAGAPVPDQRRRGLARRLGRRLQRRPGAGTETPRRLQDAETPHGAFKIA